MQPTRAGVAVAVVSTDGNAGGADGSAGDTPGPPLPSAWLIVMHNRSRQGVGRKHPVPALGFRLGSTADDLSLSGTSTTVADIQMDHDGVWRLTPRSQAPVFVNDLRATESVSLTANDEIEVLDSYFAFLTQNPVDDSYHELIYRLTIQDIPSRMANKRFLLEALERGAQRAAHRGKPFAVAAILLSWEHSSPRAVSQYLRLLGRTLVKVFGREVALGRNDEFELVLALPDTSSQALTDRIFAAFATLDASDSGFRPSQVRIGAIVWGPGSTPVGAVRAAAAIAQ